MNKKCLISILILVIMTMILCGTCALADESFQNDNVSMISENFVSGDYELSVDYKNNKDKNDHDNNVFIKGETFTLIVSSKINLEKTDIGDEIKYELNILSYKPNIKMQVVSDGADGKKVELKEENEKLKVTSDENKLKNGEIDFEYNIAVDDLIKEREKLGLGNNPAGRIEIYLFVKNNEITSKTISTIIFLYEEDAKSPNLDVYIGDKKVTTKEWVNEDVTIKPTFRDIKTVGYKNFKYKLEGATSLDETELESGDKFTISNEGTTTITIYAIDKKDRISDPTIREIKIDKKHPEITINEELITVNVTDEATEGTENSVSGVDNKSLKYFWSKEDISDLSEKNFESASTYSLGNEISKTGQATGNYYLYVMAKDIAGNITTKRSDNLILIDKTAPEVTFSPNSNEDYSNNVSVEVTIKDIVEGTAELSRIDKSSIKYLWKNSTSTPSDAEINKTLTEDKIKDFENSVKLTILNDEGVEGTYYLWICVKDTSNNIAKTKAGPFKIDTKKPTITFFPTNISDDYKQEYNLRVTYNDSLSKVNEESLKYFWSSEKIENLEEIQKDKFTKNFKIELGYGYNIRLDSDITDGEYYLYVYGEDNAGNKAVGKIGPLKVDRTAPKISFEPSEDKINPKKVTVTIDDYSPLITKKFCWTNTSSEPGLSNMENITDDSLIFNVPEDDGIWYLWIYATDSAYKYSKKMSSKIIIDHKAPEKPTIIAKHEGTDAEIVNESLVKPKVLVEIIPGKDTRDDAVISLDIEITKGGIKIENIDELKNGEGKYVLTENGEYVVTAKCIDDANNKSEEEILKFTIDENIPDGPEINLKEENTENVVLDNNTVNKNVEISIIEKAGETTIITITDSKGIDVTNLFRNDEKLVINQSGTYKINFKTSSNAKPDISIETVMNITIDMKKPIAYDDNIVVGQNQQVTSYFNASDNMEIAEYIVESGTPSKRFNII